MYDIQVKSSTIEAVYALTLQIPEFAPHYPLERFYERLNDRTHLILEAEVEGQAAGFKVGYELEQDVFYSWIGAVLPNFRRRGVAKALADEMETWLIQKSYHTLQMKTHNRFKNMLLFAIGNDFNITKVEERESVEQYRIWLEKRLE